MAYELADFAQAIEAVRAGMRPFEAPAGTFGSIGHFRDVTLASLALMDEARRQTGISSPSTAARTWKHASVSTQAPMRMQSPRKAVEEHCHGTV